VRLRGRTTAGDGAADAFEAMRPPRHAAGSAAPAFSTPPRHARRGRSLSC